MRDERSDTKTEKTAFTNLGHVSPHVDHDGREKFRRASFWPDIAHCVRRGQRACEGGKEKEKEKKRALLGRHFHSAVTLEKCANDDDGVTPSH